jgi:hypothetical protein
MTQLTRLGKIIQRDPATRSPDRRRSRLRRAGAVLLLALVAAVGWLAFNYAESDDPPRRGTPAAPNALGPPNEAAAAAARRGLWISRREIARLPRSGRAWAYLEEIADGDIGRADISVQNNLHGGRTFGVALAYARTGEARYRRKARAAIMSAIGTERGGTSLALGRNLAAYVLAADLINLRRMSRSQDRRFRRWIGAARTRSNPGNPRWPNLIVTSENTSSNWGAFANASRIAIDLYLGDTRDLRRAAQIHLAYVDRSAYPRGRPWGAYFQPTAAFDPAHWACNPSRWTAVNPPCTKRGYNLDGAFVEDISREPAQQTRLPQVPESVGVSYSWETLQGVAFQAELLRRAGYPSLWTLSGRALKRAASFIRRAGWYERFSVTAHVPWLVNWRYGTRFPTRLAQYGRLVGFTDWTHRR